MSSNVYSVSIKDAVKCSGATITLSESICKQFPKPLLINSYVILHLFSLPGNIYTVLVHLDENVTVSHVLLTSSSQ